MKLRNILTCLVAFVFASTQVVADDLKQIIANAGQSSDYDGAGVVVVFDSTLVKVMPTGLSHMYQHKLVKILTEQGGLDNRTLIFGYDPLSAWAEIQSVRIIRKSGDVDVFDLKQVKDYAAPARMIYWGARELMADLGRLEPGDAVEVRFYRKGFTYALLQTGSDPDEQYIPPMRGHYYDIVPFWSSDPVIEKVYRVCLPKDKPVQYSVYNGTLASSLLFKGDKMVYTFSLKNIRPLKTEPSMVALSDVAPKLLLSTSPDWEAKSMWFYGVNEDYGSFKSNKEIDAKVNEVLKGARTELDSISLLTHWVADEIRYSGISMGKGEGYTLHSGAMNFTDRCGVCKDKAGMLITMLRAAGFKSYAAMTMAGERIDRIPADQFNHSVTVVQRRSGEYMLLDPTWVPFVRELWSSAEQQQNYLMGLPKGADLMETPVSAPENHYLRMAAVWKISQDGTLEGEITLTAEGQTDASVRSIFSRSAPDAWNSNLEKEILRLAPTANITSMDYTNPDEYQKQPVSITVRFAAPAYALVSNDAIVFKPFAAGGFFSRAQSHLYMNTNVENRQFDFRDRCSRLIEITESFELPEGYKMATPASVAKLGNETASYQRDVVQQSNTLTINEKVVLGKRIYKADEWPVYRDVVKKQKELTTKEIVLKK